MIGRNFRGVLLICAALVCASPATSQQTTQQAQVQNAPSSGGFQEEVVGELSPGSELESVRSTVRHLAWVEKQAGKQSVRLDGKQQGGIYDDAKYLHFTPDEQHLMFVAKRNSKWVLMQDDQERSPEYSSITSVTFQPNGTSMAYCACQEKKCRLVVDGSATGAEYEDITYPQYTSDGRRIAYFGKHGKKWVSVVDGKELGPQVGEVVFGDWGFSPDGGHFYAAASLKGNNWTYVVDGTAGPPFAVVSPIAFSGDGKHYAYAGTEAKYGVFSKSKTFGTLVLDGQAKADYEGKGFGGLWKPMQEEIVRGVRNFTPDFHGLSNPEFNPEDKLVYAARRSKGDVAVLVEDESGPGFDEIVSPIVFSSDVKHFAYIAQQGEDFVEVRDNRPGAKFPGKRQKRILSSEDTLSFVPWIAMTQDAAHLAYEIVRGGSQFEAGLTRRALRRVVTDGQAGPEYDALSFSGFGFTSEFAHYGYEIHGVEGKHDRVVVDAHESRLYDAVGSLSFHREDKRTSFIAQDGQKFLRVSFAIP